MIITTEIKMDLRQSKTFPMIDAVQTDSYCRNVKLHLYEGSYPFPIPKNASIIIRYRKSDGKGGEYDTLPDGTPAWSAQSNTLKIALAPQVLTAAGEVTMTVSILQGNSLLSTFPLSIKVASVAQANKIESGNYNFVTGFLPAPAQAKSGQYLRILETDENGHVLSLEASDTPAGSLEPEQVKEILDSTLKEAGLYAYKSDPNVPDWVKQPQKPTYTAAEIGAADLSTVTKTLTTHDQSAEAHPDLRQELELLDNGKADRAYVDGQISAAISQKLQLEANFASTPDECVDTTKVYILPDGMIWAYLPGGAGGYTNRLPLSTDENGTVYNQVGYKKGYRLSSSGTETEYSAYTMFISGYIPCKKGDVIRLRGVTFQKDAESSTNQRISFYDASFNHRAQSIVNVLKDAVINENHIVTEFILQDNEYCEIPTDTAYFRICAAYMDGGSIISVNEEIVESADYQWSSTGHAFIPADYEDRIISLESEVESQDTKSTALETRVSRLESGESENDEGYIQTAAEALALQIQSHQSSSSCSIAFISDSHCGWYLDTEHKAIRHAAHALDIVSRRCYLDCLVHGGDMTTGSYESTASSCRKDISDYAQIMGVVNIPTSLWLVGNHDDAPYQATADRLSQDDVYCLIGKRNCQAGSVHPRGCNYGYRDFEAQKIRLIYLDTSDHRDIHTDKTNHPNSPAYLAAHNIGATQLQWLVDTALDLSEKEDSALWSIIVCSHVQLNVTGSIQDSVSGELISYSTANASAILNGYQSGNRGSISVHDGCVNYDFSAMTKRAKILCLVHGHVHAYTEETIGNLLSIGCPNAMNGREKPSANGVTYTKVEGTPLGTAFCILTVDRANQRIYADHYGAGISRSWILEN